MTGSRSIERAREIAERVAASSGTDYLQAAQSSEIVILTVPWQAVQLIVHTLPLDGKILVDATNPYLDDSFDGRESIWPMHEPNLGMSREVRRWRRTRGLLLDWTASDGFVPADCRRCARLMVS